jgi:hypothetical protein
MYCDIIHISNNYLNYTPENVLGLDDISYMKQNTEDFSFKDKTKSKLFWVLYESHKDRYSKYEDFKKD